jgi:hypothetical protein
MALTSSLLEDIIGSNKYRERHAEIGSDMFEVQIMLRLVQTEGPRVNADLLTQTGSEAQGDRVCR